MFRLKIAGCALSLFQPREKIRSSSVKFEDHCKISFYFNDSLLAKKLDL